MSVACTPCGVGRFSPTGQSACTPCEAGKFARVAGSESCTPCPLGYDSVEGSSDCLESQNGYFVHEGVSVLCPSNSVCRGGSFMPQPDRGFWVDRRSLGFANQVYRCPRDTCNPANNAGGDPANSRRVSVSKESCWLSASYSTHEYDDDYVCSTDKLLCMEGARSPLCGSCDDGYIYSSAERVCLTCDVSQARAFAVAAVAVAALIALSLFLWVRKVGKLPSCMEDSWAWGVLKQVDGGALKVVWSNYQVTSSWPALFHIKPTLTYFPLVRSCRV
jgi:hypothetical protein